MLNLNLYLALSEDLHSRGAHCSEDPLLLSRCAAEIHLHLVTPSVNRVPENREGTEQRLLPLLVR